MNDKQDKKKWLYIWNIWKWCLQHNKDGEMSVVIKKLTHPNSLTHQYYKQKWMKFILVGFPERERERDREKFQNFKAYFSRISSPFFLPPWFSLLFPPYFSIFHSFSQKWGEFLGQMTKWEASITVTCYTYASHPFLPPHQLISSFSDF